MIKRIIECANYINHNSFSVKIRFLLFKDKNIYETGAFNFGLLFYKNDFFMAAEKDKFKSHSHILYQILVLTNKRK